MEKDSSSVIAQIFLETSLMMLINEIAENENTAPHETTPKNPQQKLQKTLGIHDENTIVTIVNVLLPEKSGFGIEMFENILRLLRKNQRSVPSSRSCRRRTDFGGEFMEKEAISNSEVKQGTGTATQAKRVGT